MARTCGSKSGITTRVLGSGTTRLTRTVTTMSRGCSYNGGMIVTKDIVAGSLIFHDLAGRGLPTSLGLVISRLPTMCKTYMRYYGVNAPPDTRFHGYFVSSCGLFGWGTGRVEVLTARVHGPGAGRMSGVDSLRFMGIVGRRGFLYIGTIRTRDRDVTLTMSTTTGTVVNNKQLVCVKTNASKHLKILSTSRYPPAFKMDPRAIVKLVTKNCRELISTNRNTRSGKTTTVHSLGRVGCSSGSVLINVSTTNNTRCILDTVGCTGDLNYGAITIASGGNSTVSVRTSVSVYASANTRIIANSAHLGTKATRGLILGVVSANTVVGYKRICRGLVVGLGPSGVGLHGHMVSVIHRLAGLSRRTTVHTLSTGS